MPIKDPDKKRAYERAYRRRERAQKRLGELVDPRRPKVAGIPTQQVDDVDKAELGAELIKRGRSVLLSADMPLTAKDALELVREGFRLLDSAAAQTIAIERIAAPIDISGILSNPAAMAAAMELLRYAQPGPGATGTAGGSIAATDAGSSGGSLQQRKLGPLSAPGAASRSPDESGER